MNYSYNQDYEINNQLKKTNFYERLDIKTNATQNQIKKSYKKLALKYHPDKNSASNSKQVFHRLSQAYDILSDPNKRIIYDQQQLNNNKTNKPSFNNQYNNKNTFFNNNNNNNNNNNLFNKNNNNHFNKKQFSEFKRQYTSFSTSSYKYNEKFNTFKNQNEQLYKKYYQTYMKFMQKQNQYDNKAKQQRKQTDNSNKKTQKQNNRYKNNFYNNNYTQRNFNNNSNNSNNNNNKQTFSQYKLSQQKKIRLQKQRQRYQANLKHVKIGFFIFFIWLLFSLFRPNFKPSPLFSMHQTQHFNKKTFTSKLNTPFYVNQKYFIKSSDKLFKQSMEKKIDVIYLKALNKVCNTMKVKQDKIYQMIINVKNNKEKKKLKKQLKKVDKQSCEKLKLIKQSNQEYFKDIFMMNQL